MLRVYCYQGQTSTEKAKPSYAHRKNAKKAKLCTQKKAILAYANGKMMP